jgi:hypothetical protein
MLLRGITAVYSENEAKSINKMCVETSEILKMWVGRTYSYGCDLNGLD